MARKNIDFLLIGGIILLSIGVLSYSGAIDNVLSDSNKKKVTCNVNIDNDIFFNADIKGLSCSTTQGCGLFGSVGELGIISDYLSVELEAGGESASKTVSSSKIPFFDKTVRVSLCVDKAINSGTINLIKNGNVDDSRSISF